ncbi:unnamed protein product [Effrenium voratum]|nr:unnamed protein product [Effrenium voratum]
MASDDALLQKARRHLDEILGLQKFGRKALQQERRKAIGRLWFVAGEMLREAKKVLRLGEATGPGPDVGHLKFLPDLLQEVKELAISGYWDVPEALEKAQSILVIARRLQELLEPYVGTVLISDEGPHFLAILPAQDADLQYFCQDADPEEADPEDADPEDADPEDADPENLDADVGPENAGSEQSESNCFTRPTRASDPRSSGVPMTDIADVAELPAELPVVERQVLELELAERKVQYRHQDHEDIASTLYRLGHQCSKEGNRPRAKELLDEALQMFRRLHGDSNHPNIAATLHELGDLCRTTGDLPRAEQFFQQALQMERAVRGNSNHASIAATLHELGDLCRARWDLLSAKELLQEALEMKNAVYGDADHASTAVTLHALGCLFRDGGHLPEAKEFLQKALKMKRAAYRNRNHTNIAATLHALGGVCRLEDDLSEAERHLLEALDMLRAVHGDYEHSNIVATLWALGGVHQQAGDLSEAKKRRDEALEMKLALSCLFSEEPGEEIQTAR